MLHTGETSQTAFVHTENCKKVMIFQFGKMISKIHLFSECCAARIINRAGQARGAGRTQCAHSPAQRAVQRSGPGKQRAAPRQGSTAARWSHYVVRCTALWANEQLRSVKELRSSTGQFHWFAPRVQCSAVGMCSVRVGRNVEPFRPAILHCFITLLAITALIVRARLWRDKPQGNKPRQCYKLRMKRGTASDILYFEVL